MRTVRWVLNLPRYVFLRLRGRCVACGSYVNKASRGEDWAVSLHCQRCLNGPVPGQG